MSVSARSTSASNLNAASGLCSKYQSKAASYSTDASSWNATALVGMGQLRQIALANFCPCSGLGLTGI